MNKIPSSRVLYMLPEPRGLTQQKGEGRTKGKLCGGENSPNMHLRKNIRSHKEQKR